MNVIGCPSQYCKSVGDAVRLFELFEKGIMPIAGGALDQSAWFLAAQRQFRIDDLTMNLEADHE